MPTGKRNHDVVAARATPKDADPFEVPGAEDRIVRAALGALPFAEGLYPERQR